MGVRSCVFAVIAVFALSCGGAEPASAALDGPLSYARSGGIAGIVERLSVQPDYRAKVTTRAGTKAFRLSKAERSRLSSALARANLAHVRIEKTPPFPDAFVYRLRYRGRTLDFHQGNAPARVKRLLAELGRLVTAHGPRS
jgi:hypothetical protein